MVNFHDLEFGGELLDMISKAQAIKIKIDKLDFIKTKKLVHHKISRKWKDNLQNGKKCANHISDKDLISKIHKELLQLNNKDNPIFKIVKEPEYTFLP